jgi:hypothetical protein
MNDTHEERARNYLDWLGHGYSREQLDRLVSEFRATAKTALDVKETAVKQWKPWKTKP